jgi:hypothetical protein
MQMHVKGIDRGAHVGAFRAAATASRNVAAEVSSKVSTQGSIITALQIGAMLTQ